MPKVLISDKLSTKAEEIFKVRGIDVDVKVGLSEEELKDIIPNYDALAIRSATKVRQDILDKATNLKVVGRAGIGVDNIDVPQATSKGVVVMNTPFGNSITTAEHAIAMMFALARQIPLANQSTHAGKWEKSKFMGVELTNKVLGIVGCGNIGGIVADRALGLKMKVFCFDPFLSEDRAQEMGVTKVELDDLLNKADFITIHTPLNDKTRGLINADAFEKMKEGVRIINCARGGIIVETDLKNALESGKVAGAALDVFEVEPAKDNVLFGMENVICTPHLGAATREAQENVAIQVAEQISDYLLDGAITNALNTPSLSAEEARKLEPYMTLSKQLGTLLGQISDTSFEEVTMTYEGDVSCLNTKPLTSLIMNSLLGASLDSVNVVNVLPLAKERGIKIIEATSNDTDDYQTCIRLEVKTEKQTYSIEGTLFGHKKPRIVSINEVPIESEISAQMLYVQNNDKPGFIGALGTLLGDAGVNIANFNLGRKDEDDTAIALISLDGEVEKDLLKQMQNLDHVVQIKALKF